MTSLRNNKKQKKCHGQSELLIHENDMLKGNMSPEKDSKMRMREREITHASAITPTMSSTTLPTIRYLIVE